MDFNPRAYLRIDHVQEEREYGTNLDDYKMGNFEDRIYGTNLDDYKGNFENREVLIYDPKTYGAEESDELDLYEDEPKIGLYEELDLYEDSDSNSNNNFNNNSNSDSNSNNSDFNYGNSNSNNNHGNNSRNNSENKINKQILVNKIYKK